MILFAGKTVVVGIDWLRNGEALVSADRRGLVVTWDAHSGRVIATTSVPNSRASDPSAPPLATSAAARYSILSFLFIILFFH